MLLLSGLPCWFSLWLPWLQPSRSASPFRWATAITGPAVCGAGWLDDLHCLHYPWRYDRPHGHTDCHTAAGRAFPLFAIRHKAPITVFLLTGIFPLVPGAGIYYTAYYFLRNDRALCTSKGIETLKVAVALALGIASYAPSPCPSATPPTGRQNKKI
mgnify:CR=1 FL=1